MQKGKNSSQINKVIDLELNKPKFSINKLKELDDDIDMFFQDNNMSPMAGNEVVPTHGNILSTEFTVNSILADIIREYQDDRPRAIDSKIKPRINNRCSRGHCLANPETISKGKIILQNRTKNDSNKAGGINLNMTNQIFFTE